MKNINWFRVVLYLSFLFLCYALYKADYLTIPTIFSKKQLVFSFVFLLAGFIAMCDNWRVMLKSDGIVDISVRDSIVSNGLSVFTKYIPGKIMVVMGRALYINQSYNVPVKTLAITSFKTQMITLWIGLIMGMVILFKIELDYKTILPAIIFITLFSVFLYSKALKKLINTIAKKLIKKQFDYPVLTIKNSFKVIPSFVLNWSLWCLGFYFLCNSLVDYNFPLAVGLSFALAGTLAIIALVAPGGLGVREGLLVVCLLAFGLKSQDAVTISVASRLWFLVGEFFIFLLSIILKQNKYPFKFLR